MKVAQSLQASPSRQAVEEVMAVVEDRLAAMGAMGATNNYPNMEEVTTTSLQATALLCHRATVSRVTMAKVEVKHGFILTSYVYFAYLKVTAVITVYTHI